jgi:hypothetical protein
MRFEAIDSGVPEIDRLVGIERDTLDLLEWRAWTELQQRWRKEAALAEELKWAWISSHTGSFGRKTAAAAWLVNGQLRIRRLYLTLWYEDPREAGAWKAEVLGYLETPRRQVADRVGERLRLRFGGHWVDVVTNDDWNG